MPDLHLSELLMLREEIAVALDSTSKQMVDMNDNFSRINYLKTRYKRLVRLYEKLDGCILDSLDDVHDMS